MSDLIHFRKSYTQAEWSKLEQLSIEGGYKSVSDMIRKKTARIVNNTELCADCGTMKARRSDKNLRLRFPGPTTEKLFALAKERGLNASEFIARKIIDPLI